MSGVLARLRALPDNAASARWPGYAAQARAWASFCRAAPVEGLNALAAAALAPARSRSGWFQAQGASCAAPLDVSLPPVPRSLLQQQPGLFIGDVEALELGYRGRTSGSTGEPVEVFMCPWAIGHYAVHLEDVLGRAGLPLPRRLVYLSVQTGAAEFSEPIPAWPEAVTLRLDSRSDESIDALLEAAEPEVVTLSPSALLALLRELRRPLPSLGLVLTTAEVLTPALRASAQEALGCVVVDSFGVAEIGPVGASCPRGGAGYHVAPCTVVEALGGQLAVTTLRNRALPLARYLPGDRVARVEQAPCPACGHVGATFFGVEGRAGAWLLDGRGEACSPLPLLRVLMDGAWAIAQHQLQAEGPGRVVARVLPTPGAWLDRGGLAAALEAAAEGLGLSVELRTEPPTPSRSGKILSVVQGGQGGALV